MLTAEETLIAIVPALIANGSATLIAKGRPIDCGRKFIDGRRVLGDGKTLEGTFIALSYGLSVSIALYFILNSIPLLIASMLAVIGAILGDLAGSFVKRRMGLERGAPLPIVDQLDFYVGAVVGMYLSGAEPNALVLAAAAPVVYAMHRITNYLAYKIGVKSVPW